MAETNPFSAGGTGQARLTMTQAAAMVDATPAEAAHIGPIGISGDIPDIDESCAKVGVAAVFPDGAIT